MIERLPLPIRPSRRVSPVATSTWDSSAPLRPALVPATYPTLAAPAMSNPTSVPRSSPTESGFSSVPSFAGCWSQSRSGLAATSYAEVSSWPFADFVFGWDYDFFADSSKSRRAGFHEYVATDEMFFGLFADLQKRRIIP